MNSLFRMPGMGAFQNWDFPEMGPVRVTASESLCSPQVTARIRATKGTDICYSLSHDDDGYEESPKPYPGKWKGNELVPSVPLPQESRYVERVVPGSDAGGWLEPAYEKRKVRVEKRFYRTWNEGGSWGIGEGYDYHWRYVELGDGYPVVDPWS